MTDQIGVAGMQVGRAWDTRRATSTFTTALFRAEGAARDLPGAVGSLIGYPTLDAAEKVSAEAGHMVGIFEAGGRLKAVPLRYGPSLVSDGNLPAQVFDPIIGDVRIPGSQVSGVSWHDTIIQKFPQRGSREFLTMRRLDHADPSLRAVVDSHHRIGHAIVEPIVPPGSLDAAASATAHRWGTIGVGAAMAVGAAAMVVGAYAAASQDDGLKRTTALVLGGGAALTGVAAFTSFRSASALGPGVPRGLALTIAAVPMAISAAIAGFS